jgi:hypothetical protein
MKFLNPYNITLDVRGYLDILFLPHDTIEICYFEPIKTLANYGNFPSNTSLNKALVLSKAAYAKFIYSSPSKIHFFIPLTTLSGYSMIEQNTIWYYKSMFTILYFDAKVSYLDNKGEIVLTDIVNGGEQFLNVSIKGVK